MNIRCNNGLIGYGEIYGSKAREKIQKDLEECGIEKIWSFDSKVESDAEFVRILKQNLGR